MSLLKPRREKRSDAEIVAASAAGAETVPARREPLSGPNAIIAAATIGADQIPLAKRNNAWAEQAWDYYDAIGELRYSAAWIGNALSRATLFIARAPEPGGQPEKVDDDSEANEALNALAGGMAGQSEMLKAFGIHLTIAGDCYLVGYNAPLSGAQKWVVRSPEEVNSYPGTVTIRMLGQDLALPEDEVAIVRIWRPHPRRSWEADSPTRGVLPILHELERLTQMVLASANSRLAGAGLLLIPNEFDFPNPAQNPVNDPDSNPAASKAQAFVNRLGTAMITPVTDRADPSAVVPVVITAPGDQIGNAKLISFWTPLDEQAIELRKEAVRRFALGMDVPPEIVLGLGQSTHWNAWMVDEAAIKLHIEPLLGLICDALTVGFLKPLLGEDTDLMIWFDTAELVQRPNRGPDALQAYDRDELSGEALLRELGFTEGDQPSDEELKQRQLRQMVKTGGGSMAQQAAVELGIFPEPPAAEDTGIPEEEAPADDFTTLEDAETMGEQEAPAAEQETTTEPGVPQTGPPDTFDQRRNAGPPASRTASATAAVPPSPVVNLTPVLVAHALDYVGKRWMKKHRGAYAQGLPASRIHEQYPIPEEKIDALMAGVFDAIRGSAPDYVLDAVTDYVRHLTINGRRHDPEKMINALAGASRGGTGDTP